MDGKHRHVPVHLPIPWSSFSKVPVPVVPRHQCTPGLLPTVVGGNVIITRTKCVCVYVYKLTRIARSIGKSMASMAICLHATRGRRAPTHGHMGTNIRHKTNLVQDALQKLKHRLYSCAWHCAGLLVFCTHCCCVLVGFRSDCCGRGISTRARKSLLRCLLCKYTDVLIHKLPFFLLYEKMTTAPSSCPS